ncbi:uncharacterized protein zgc:162331 isoform X2 [Polypterus senegalus]|uniref:uncharacterized protein zgc:162331 isoform X2 n=1 Tax=Polypterus senegalus TaxID=55291 RepID=UPI001965A4F8|nr:uncharacterized protein zgc:162331 isoform X2 [Polypterus senegalus]
MRTYSRGGQLQSWRGTLSTALQCELHTSQCCSFFIEEGSGTSVGTILVFWCKEGYQLVGSEKVTCELRRGAPVWNNHFPVCEAIPQPEDKGFQLAVLVSIISCIIILTLSASFIVCCIRQKRLHLSENKREVSDRSQKDCRQRQRKSCWIERNRNQLNISPRHFSYERNPRLSILRSSFCPGRSKSYINKGYQRSHENLQKSSRQEIFSERRQYCNVVLQRILIPNAAPSLHLPPQSIDIHMQMVTTHPNLLFSSPMETPQRHCLLLQPV